MSSGLIYWAIRVYKKNRDSYVKVSEGSAISPEVRERPERKNPSKTRRIEDFYRQFSSTENLDLIAWNIRSPLPKQKTRSILDQDLFVLMQSGATVGVMLLQRFANPVPDRQMWPTWFDAEQELGAE